MIMAMKCLFGPAMVCLGMQFKRSGPTSVIKRLEVVFLAFDQVGRDWHQCTALQLERPTIIASRQACQLCESGRKCVG